MKDRIPTYPGRVRLTPVSGQANVYDLERADEPRQDGTPLNKNTFMDDFVTEGFDLPTTGTPNDIFRWLCLHRWDKYALEYKEYRDKENGLTYNNYNSGWGDFSPTASDSTRTVIEYSATISVNQQTGEITLDNPTTYTVSSTSTPFKEKYFKIVTRGTICNLYLNTIYYATSYFTFNTNKSRNGQAYSYELGNVIRYKSEWRVNPDYVEHLTSESENEYPNPSGSSGNNYFNYLDKLKSIVDSGVSVEFGRYIGTGTSTQSAPVVIPCQGCPILLVVSPDPIPSECIDEASSRAGILISNLINALLQPNRFLNSAFFIYHYGASSSDPQMVSNAIGYFPSNKEIRLFYNSNQTVVKRVFNESGIQYNYLILTI